MAVLPEDGCTHKLFPRDVGKLSVVSVELAGVDSVRRFTSEKVEYANHAIPGDDDMNSGENDDFTYGDNDGG